MDLILFTTNFPLGASEQFVECEIIYLARSFEKITIVPLTASGIPHARPLPENVTFLPPMLPFGLNDKFPLALKGLVNTAPLLPFLHDFFSKGGYMSARRLLHWLSATAIARAAYCSDSFRTVKKRITSNTLFYFYWGDKSSALSPFLKNCFPTNKVITRFHGSDLYEIKTPGYIPFREDLIKTLDLAVFISNNGLQFFRNRFPDGIKSSILSRLGVIDNGTGNPSSDGILRLVTCSNAVPIKRLHLLIEALKMLDIRVYWKHFGDGDVMADIKARANELPGNIKTDFVGLVQNSKIISFYKERPVDLFINTSSSEGIPVSIMEAISFGIPIIAPAVGGIPEIVEGSHGYLLSPASTPVEISSAIMDYYRLPASEKSSMRANARIFWKKNYDADVNYTEFCRYILNNL